MDPITPALALSAGKSVLGGMSAFGQARAEKERSEINSNIRS